MNAFEQLVGEMLWSEGYWVQNSLKVELTKLEKSEIGRTSSPRWELDLVGYHAADNLVRVVECKSYLDSNGVHASAFDGSNPTQAKRYKLFNEPETRRVILKRLSLQLHAKGTCLENPAIQLTLACGKIRNETDREKIRAHFKENGWDLWDEAWLVKRLKQMAKEGYENRVSSLVAKLLLKGHLAPA